MIWVGIIIVVYLVGLTIAVLAIDTNDEISGRAYAYSCGFVFAILTMLIYMNTH